jgi:hypothetical protein
MPIVYGHWCRKCFLYFLLRCSQTMDRTTSPINENQALKFTPCMSLLYVGKWAKITTSEPKSAFCIFYYMQKFTHFHIVLNRMQNTKQYCSRSSLSHSGNRLLYKLLIVSPKSVKNLKTKSLGGSLTIRRCHKSDFLEHDLAARRDTRSK